MMINNDALKVAPEDWFRPLTEYSIRRDGSNSDYEYQDLPFATMERALADLQQVVMAGEAELVGDDRSD